MFDINFIKYRPPIHITKSARQKLEDITRQIGIAVSGMAMVGAIAGYGALTLGRDVPTALALGSLGTAGAAGYSRLRE